MHRLFISFVAICFVLFCSQGCGKNDTTSTDNKSAKAADGATDNTNDGGLEDSTVDCQFNILKSSAGIPKSFNGLHAEMDELKAKTAQIVISEAKDGALDFYIVYSFAEKLAENSSVFSLSFEKVPYHHEDGVFSFDAKEQEAMCRIDDLSAEYSDVSLTGNLGAEDSNLAIEGVVNGYPFALNIASVTSSDKEFVPEYLEPVLIDRIPFVEFEVTNQTQSKVDFAMTDQANLNVHFELEASQTSVYGAYLEDFPSEVTAEIVYGDGNKLVVSGQDLLSSESFKRDAPQQKWYLSGEINGAIVSAPFACEHFVIRNL